MSGFLGGLFGTEHKKPLPAPPLPKRNKSYETRRNEVLSREARAKNAKRLRKHRETMQTQLGDIDDYSNTGAGATAQKRQSGSLTDDMREDLSKNPFEFMGGKTRKRIRKRRRKTKRKGRRKTKKKRKRRKRKTRRKR